ncbi:MAG TPA: DUF4895 domain-containing protein [Thermotogaceae bacterium]|nr:DUF4895 domain-containing protein [Thermotogaceae bacterium]
MDQELLWLSETEVFVGLKKHLEIYKNAYHEVVETALKLREEILLKYEEKIKSGGRYCFVFSLGSRKRETPFVNFYLTDDSKALLILSSQAPLSLGENIMPLNNEEIFNVLHKVLIKVCNKDYESKNMIMKGAVLAKYKFSTALELFGDLKLFKREVLKENIENENNLSLMLNSKERDIEIILKDWARWKSCQNGKISFFVQPYNDRILVFLAFPEAFLNFNDNLIFEIARYLRDEVSKRSGGTLTKGYLPENVSIDNKILTIFSIPILNYPKLSNELLNFFQEFVEKISKILSFIENESSNLYLFGGEQIGI